MFEQGIEQKFEQGTRLKLRFKSVGGLITIEDLWDLPLNSKNKMNLDDIAKDLHKQLKSFNEISFLKVDKNDKKIELELQLKFDIVRHIINVKINEIKEKEQGEIIRTKKEELEALIKEKENDEKRNKSIEELKNMLKEYMNK